MIPPMPTESTPIDASSDYRPISGLAVASVIAAGLFVFIVLAIAVVVISSGKPVLMWSALLPGAVAIALGLAARWHIASSEGTREGTSLSKFAISTSLIFAVGYTAYLLADSLAVQGQTARVAEIWFDRLRAGDLYGAFLLNLEPGARASLEAENPEDNAQVARQNKLLEGRFGRAGLQTLRNSELVQVLRRAGDKVELTWRGAGALDYEATGYRTTVNYDLKTPEGSFQVTLNLASTDGKEFVGLQRWHIQPTETITRSQLTRLGRIVRELQVDANQVGREFLKAADQGDIGRAYLMSLPADRRREVISSSEKLARGGGAWLPISLVLHGLFPAGRPTGAIALTPLTALGPVYADPDSARMATLVGFDAFLHEPSQAGPERFQINMTPPLASEQRDRYRRLLLRPGGVAAPASLGPGSSDPVRLTSYDGTGPVQVEIPVEMPSPETGKGRIKGRLVLQLNQPELQSELRSLFSGEDWAKQPLMDPGGSAVIEKLERPWRVVAIESAGEPVPQAPGPGGPDGPPEGFPGMPH